MRERGRETEKGRRREQGEERRRTKERKGKEKESSFVLKSISFGRLKGQACRTQTAEFLQ